MNRVVVNFSCGVSSAVAGKIALREGLAEVVNIYIAEEHPDNRRFLADCEQWYGRPITVLRDDRYGASIIEVFRRERFVVGPFGAACSTRLKRRVFKSYSRPNDTVIVGYTADEEARHARLFERLRCEDIHLRSPLIEKGLSKADCMAIMAAEGLRPPAMYELGYNNANCIGCVKGGKGYWTKIRRDFPEVFDRMVQIEGELGIALFGKRGTLRGLPRGAGRAVSPVVPDCGLFCEQLAGDVLGEWPEVTG